VHERWSVDLPGADGLRRMEATMRRLATEPPATLASRPVSAVDQPAPGVVRLQLADGTRVVVRPSGTEPKLKSSVEVVVDAGADLAATRARAESDARAVRASLASFVDDATMEG